MRPGALLSHALTQLEKAATNAALLLNRRRNLFLIFCTVCYALVTVYRASRKQFWFDELFTVYLAHQRPGRLWDALMNGADFNPPLLHLITGFSQALFGIGHISARLPQILGFWILCLCLFRFVSVRSNALAGFISMAIPLLTTAYFYAYEARAYGIVLGCCGLSLISWQEAAGRMSHRFWPLLGLILSLAVAMATHTYAFLLFIPLAVGELTRFALTRRLDRAVLYSLCLSASAGLISLPLLLAVKRFGGGVNWPASAIMILRVYDTLFYPAITLMVIVIALLYGDYRVYKHAPAAGANMPADALLRDGHRFEPHEQAALYAFLAIPCFTYLAARLVRVPMMDRYSLAAVVGLACLLGMAVSKKAVIGMVVLALMTILVADDFFLFVGDVSISEPSSLVPIGTDRDPYHEAYHWMSSEANKGLPIVLLDDLDFLPMFYYASADLASRLVYLERPKNDVDGLMYEELRRCCNATGRVATLEKILSTNDSFLAYSTKRSHGRLNQLAESGARVSMREINNDYGLFYVDFRPREVSEAKHHDY